MKMKHLTLIGAFSVSLRTVLSATKTVVSNFVQPGNSVAQMISGASGLDGPKMAPKINATTFDWWYFDAVSEDDSCAVVVVFYLSTDIGFPFVPPLSAISVDIFATFADGSNLFIPLNSLPLDAGAATIVTDGDGASGIWKGTGFSFMGAPDLSKYVVKIDSPLIGVKGTLELYSVRLQSLTVPCVSSFVGS